MMSEALGVMLCGHGSRNEDAVEEFAGLAQHLKARLPEYPVEFGYLEPLEREIEQIWHVTLQRGVDDGEFRSDLDIALAYRFIRDVLFVKWKWWS